MVYVCVAPEGAVATTTMSCSGASAIESAAPELACAPFTVIDASVVA
jgi:hypothetical protein